MASLSASSTSVVGRDSSSYGYGHLERHATDAKSGLGKIRSSSNEYQNLVQTINKYWVGEDAENFKKLLASIATTVEKAYNLSDKALKTLQADKASYAQLVSRNNSAIK